MGQGEREKSKKGFYLVMRKLFIDSDTSHAVEKGSAIPLSLFCFVHFKIIKLLLKQV